MAIKYSIGTKRIMSQRIPSQNAFDMVRHFEQFPPTVYLDPGGVPTGGFGHTAGLTRTDIGTMVSPELADQWLLEDMQRVSDQVNSLIIVDINQNQFDALCDFVFNLGYG